MHTELHVVLGAGQIGARVTDLLLARGHRVRQVRLSPRGASRPQAELVAGDITDPAFAARVGRGAAVVYDCMNPPYHRWPDLLLPLAEGSLRAARSSGAKLVALDCLYLYGRPTGPLREDAPIAPCSKKGELRARQSELRLSAHRRGDVRLTIGRASDFFGEDLPYSLFNDRFYDRILSGKPAESLGDPDVLHSYTYAADIAAALVTLGARDDALGEVWHLPTAPAVSTRELMTRLGAALGRAVAVKRISPLAMRLAGLFSPFMREVQEMAYQWQAPFILDDARFRRTFGVEPTPLDAAIAATAAWARRRHASRLAA
jgi:nucleoside-diphosphate-sugar epimerase